MIHYRPQRSCGKAMFSQACVKDSVRGGCLCPSMHHRSHDQGGLCSGGSLSRGFLSRGNLCPRGSLSRGSVSRGGGSVSRGEGSLSRGGGSLSRGVSVQSVKRGLCPGGSLSRGLCLGGLCPGGVSVQECLCSGGGIYLSRGVLCPGGLCPGRESLSREGGLCQGVSVQGVSVTETPKKRSLYGNEWAVRFQLECILVLHCRGSLSLNNHSCFFLFCIGLV